MAAQLDVEKDKNRYNGEGQRIRKEETKGTESSARNYYYQDGKVLYTTDGANQRDSFNLLGREDNVIATARGTGSSETWYLYNKDVRGSTSSLIDASGTAAAAYEYDEFGNTTIRPERTLRMPFVQRFSGADKTDSVADEVLRRRERSER